MSTKKTVGIIMLDTEFERIVGDIGNPESFAYPVQYKKIEGATVQRVVDNADQKLIQPFISAAQELEAEGCDIISTSCGFLSIFHKQLKASVAVEMLTSSLLQVKTAENLIEKGKKVGILTYKKAALGDSHFKGAGIDKVEKVVYGMDECPYFTEYIMAEKALDYAKVCDEIRMMSRRMVAENDDLGAIVLECTNMPPYRNIVEEETKLAVFDVLTLINSHYYA